MKLHARIFAVAMCSSVIMYGGQADARDMAMKPSVEVHLEALVVLRQQVRDPRALAPQPAPQPIPQPAPMPSRPQADATQTLRLPARQTLEIAPAPAEMEQLPAVPLPVQRPSQALPPTANLPPEAVLQPLRTRPQSTSRVRIAPPALPQTGYLAENSRVLPPENPEPQPYVQPAPAPAPAPLIQESAQTEQRGTWWDDTVDAVGGALGSAAEGVGSVFDDSETPPARNPEEPAASAPEIHKERPQWATVTEPQAVVPLVPESAPVPALEPAPPTASLPSLKALAEPVAEVAPTPATSAPAPVSPPIAPPVINAESPKLIKEPEPKALAMPAPPAVGNAAAYDGLELQQGFMETVPDLAVAMPSDQALELPPEPLPAEAAPLPSPPPVTTFALPKPPAVADEELLAHAADAPAVDGLKDPFEDGLMTLQPAPEVTAPPSPVAPVASVGTMPDAPSSPADIAPLAAELPAKTPEPAPVAEKSSWMDDLKSSLTGYFSSEDKKDAAEVEAAAQPAATPQPLPANLPPLTKLAGDPEVMRETEQSKVIVADAPPPLMPAPNPEPQSPPLASAPLDMPFQLASQEPLPKPAAPMPKAPEPKPEAAPKPVVKKIAPQVVPAEVKPEVKAEVQEEVPPEPPAAMPAQAAVDKGKEVVLKRDDAVPAAQAEDALQQVDRPEPPASEPAVTSPPAEHTPSSIAYAAGERGLPKSAAGKLDKVVAYLNQDANARAVILAYAAGNDESDSRRLALARGLAVRGYIMDKGISALRINVQSLGNKASNGAADRVDVTVKTQ